VTNGELATDARLRAPGGSSGLGVTRAHRRDPSQKRLEHRVLDDPPFQLSVCVGDRTTRAQVRQPDLDLLESFSHRDSSFDIG
jgi:hypothetical protein